MKEKIDKRTADCIEAEMQFDGGSFLGYNDYNRDFNVSNIELICSTDEEWEKIITKLRQELKKRKS